MAYTYDFNSTHRFVVIRNASSKWTGDDILESAEEIVADDGFASDYDWIYDLRFVHSTVISVVEMERMVERFRVFRERGLVDEESRSVIVGTETDLEYTGTLYQKKANRPDKRFAIVETIEEARRWLGIEATTEIGLTE